jgi:hypothetical protein
VRKVRANLTVIVDFTFTDGIEEEAVLLDLEEYIASMISMDFEPDDVSCDVYDVEDLYA